MATPPNPGYIKVRIKLGTVHYAARHLLPNRSCGHRIFQPRRVSDPHLCGSLHSYPESTWVDGRSHTHFAVIRGSATGARYAAERGRLTNIILSEHSFVNGSLALERRTAVFELADLDVSAVGIGGEEEEGETAPDGVGAGLVTGSGIPTSERTPQEWSRHPTICRRGDGSLRFQAGRWPSRSGHGVDRPRRRGR
jgi:hypothetical protein